MLQWLKRRRLRPDAALEFRRRYASFRRLLGRNSELLSLFADLERDLRVETPSAGPVHDCIIRILDRSLDLIQDLNELEDAAGVELFPVHQRLDRKVRARLAQERQPVATPFIVPLSAQAARERDLCGGKAGNLADLMAALPDSVPGGFVITTAAYRRLAEAARMGERMRAFLAERSGSEAVLAERADELRTSIRSVEVPAELAEAITGAAEDFPEVSRWAVRSSGVGEDGRLSFAGQFETRLGVPTEELLHAYCTVAASRFSDRALAYRLDGGLAEIETPMAVLCLPMIEARAAGVLYTRDPHDPDSPCMWLSSAFGLGLEVVAGTAPADLFIITREPPGDVLERRPGTKEQELVLREGAAGITHRPVPAARQQRRSIEDHEIAALASLGLAAERHFGGPQDVEWAVDPAGKPWVLQSRPLVLGARPPRTRRMTDQPAKLAGRPLAPGRAVGPVFVAHTLPQIEETPPDSVLVVPSATPELARVLGRIAALIAASGNPQSHAAALVRQAGVPAVYDAAGALEELSDGEPVGVDGTRGEVYAGTPWPELRGRRRSPGNRPRGVGFFHDRILRLTLIDPGAKSFRADGCTSIHDIVRLVHEQALAAMFRLGDRHARGRRRAARRLVSSIPLELEILDLGGGLAPTATESTKVRPDEIVSTPFLALWRGIADPNVSWAGRRTVSAAGFASVMATTLVDESTSMRRLGDRNYVVVARDYLNLNARLAYHYAMLDAVVGELADNNYVTFRFRGGGAGRERRDLRARFLADVLVHAGFGVDRRGDLLNAWLRAAPREVSQTGLTLLGRLMACARQLDMLLSSEDDVRQYAACFLEGEYERFQ